MKILRSCLPIFLVIVGLSACVPLNRLFATPTPTPMPTEEPCAFMWATYTDETGTALLQKRLTEQSLPFDAEITRVSDFGEDCVTASGVNKGFGAMETDFSVGIEFPANATETEIGQYAIDVVKVIAANFERGKNMNAPNRGSLEFALLHAGEIKQYRRINIDEAIRAIEKGITPKDFYKQFFAVP